jgi:hypothetical protein
MPAVPKTAIVPRTVPIENFAWCTVLGFTTGPRTSIAP